MGTRRVFPPRAADGEHARAISLARSMGRAVSGRGVWRGHRETSRGGTRVRYLFVSSAAVERTGRQDTCMLPVFFWFGRLARWCAAVRSSLTETGQRQFCGLFPSRYAERGYDVAVSMIPDRFAVSQTCAYNDVGSWYCRQRELGGRGLAAVDTYSLARHGTGHLCRATADG
ncbi:hypothetical protein VTK73DRAFT_2075 [Phialemonium thermophilum]|uniref:Uncharacterized protein n=1 Tax=Phialemonium thermophilum TaxID=223376 RepID=A0ABR3VSM7_9PEZI